MISINTKIGGQVKNNPSVVLNREGQKLYSFHLEVEIGAASSVEKPVKKKVSVKVPDSISIVKGDNILIEGELRLKKTKDDYRFYINSSTVSRCDRIEVARSPIKGDILFVGTIRKNLVVSYGRKGLPVLCFSAYSVTKDNSGYGLTWVRFRKERPTQEDLKIEPRTKVRITGKCKLSFSSDDKLLISSIAHEIIPIE